MVIVDMDGTIADFEARLEYLLKKRHPDVPIPPVLNKYPFTENFEDPQHRKLVSAIYSEPGFFEKLTPIDGAIIALHEMEADPNIEVFICTTPLLSSPASASEKLQWINKYLGSDWSSRLVITCDKSLLKGKWLIDDAPRVHALSNKPSWTLIQFARPHNHKRSKIQRLEHWKDWRTVIKVDADSSKTKSTLFANRRTQISLFVLVVAFLIAWFFVT